MPAENSNIKIPVWLWTLLGLATAFAFTHTVKQYITADRVESLRVNHEQVTVDIEKINEELNRRAGVFESVDGIATDLRDIRILVREVRDDVLILKTRDKGPMKTSP